MPPFITIDFPQVLTESKDITMTPNQVSEVAAMNNSDYAAFIWSNMDKTERIHTNKAMIKDMLDKGLLKRPHALKRTTDSSTLSVGLLAGLFLGSAAYHYWQEVRKRKIIKVNIWADYDKDDQIPEGKSQMTNAYVRWNPLLSEADYHQILILVKQHFKKHTPSKDLKIKVKTTIQCLLIKNLSHQNRRALLDVLQEHPLKYQGLPIQFVSEA